ncbi:MAG TPA: alpha/beta hydrolase [Gemmatimonadaceae bacterium]|jgi:proline iminopeptidase|nr:alpha/beta hydrolase [Gemmatimonadaceae bacterium]
MSTARERFLAFRRTVPHAPRLDRQNVRAQGIEFAVFSSPPVGHAPPLLCVNGGLIVDHVMLWPSLSPLAAHRQLILYDQRGRGASKPPADPLAARIGDDASDIPALRRALGIRQWDVLGHSWGGGIAMLAAAQDPAGTRRLVLADAVGATSAWMSPLRAEAMRRSTPDDRAVLAAIDDAALGHPDPEVHLAHLRASYGAWFVDQAFASTFPMPRVASQTGSAVLAQLRRDGYDWRDRVRTIAAPTLLLHGDGDALAVDTARDNLALIPRARLEVMPQCGHFPFWEAPEPFFAAIESFLA